MFRGVAAACLAGGVLSAQQPPETVFKATTKLVQLNVVAHDNDGKPVSDLRREEFQILDNNAPQAIEVFRVEAAGPQPPLESVPDRFTNRIAPPQGLHSGYSVILIDDLFSGSDPTNEEGSSLSRVQALKAIEAMPAGEKIAVYVLRRPLQVIAEFTSDREIIVRELRKWKPAASTPAPEAKPSMQALINPAEQANHAASEMARVDQVLRAEAGAQAMAVIADHLAGIPGRKNLIWLANQFPLEGKSLASLTRAGVSIYPVDIDGVCRLCPERPKQVMDAVAAATGGVAYYGRNDLDHAIRAAVEDGRFSYTLGYYRPGEEDALRRHQVSVRATRRGVTVRHRTEYESEAPPHPESASPVADLVAAMNRPIDATVIPIDARGTRSQGSLNLDATFNIDGLDLRLEDGAWKGSAEFAARFVAADGTQAGDVFSQTIVFNMRPETYATALAGGVGYHAEWKIPAKAVEMKLLVGSLASGNIGTLTIPLSKLKEASLAK